VLPPDVNASAWDFTIEDRPEQTPAPGAASVGNVAKKAAIRFGLGAIKNVGQGPVEIICQARTKGGSFENLNEFAARVDLRSAGKRALESLIKVGAMDKFGSRAAMLEALDRLVAVSSSQFRAAEAGQLSLFGAHTGVTESVNLPLVPDADRRETLSWERELIGMYMGEHPLAAYMNELRQVVSYFSSNLGEAAHEEKVRVAGMVTAIRPHQTKTGKMMAWVTIEDLAGIIELVVFPRTWEKFQFALEVGGVILAEGKVDAQSSPSKVLVDNIRTEIKLTEPAQNAAGTKEPSQLVLQPQGRTPARKPAIPAPPRVAEIPPAYRKPTAPVPPASGLPASDLDEEPPEDPPDWENYSSGSAFFEERSSAVSNLPVAVSDQQSEAGDHLVVDEPVPDARRSPSLNPQSTIKNQPSVIVNVPPVILATPKLPVVSIPARLDDDHPPQMITVILRSSGDSQRDIRRISRLHGTFISYPGKDRFAFHIFEEGRGHLIEFPNDNTHLCPELLLTIKDAVGEENLRVEPILYQ